MKSFDPIWENNIYGEGKHLNRYPYDKIVTFIFRNMPRNKPRNECRILEIGCGAGNNLWFCAREGFSVYGIDGSQSAIQYAKERFEQENLAGDFRVGDFMELPYQDDFFDLVIDRGSLTCAGISVAEKAIDEIHRVLGVGGKFFFNPYSERHTSFISSDIQEDNLNHNIQHGTLVGVGQICFYGMRDIKKLISKRWNTINLEHIEITNLTNKHQTAHAEWQITLEKK